MKKLLSTLLISVTMFTTSLFATEGFKFDFDAAFAHKYVFRGVNQYHTANDDSMALQGSFSMTPYKMPEYSVNLWLSMPLQETDTFEDKELDFTFSWKKLIGNKEHAAGFVYYMYTENDDKNDMELFYSLKLAEARMNPIFALYLDINENEFGTVKDKSIGNMYMSAGISETWNFNGEYPINLGATLGLAKKSKESSNKNEAYFGLSDLLLSASYDYQMNEKVLMIPSLKISLPLEEDEVQEDTEVFLTVDFKF
jgi:hypothetical protein